MKDVQATLRRLDEEIVGHKQQIARHQVEIARLQDTRMVLMHLVESDQEAAEAARREERVNLINGQHAKPVLIVRKTGTGDEDGTASKAAKNGTPVTVHAKTKRDYKVDGAKYGRRKGKPSASGEMRKRIVSIMDNTPMSSQEIGDYLGLPRDEASRKAMSNALYQLRVKGQLTRDDEYRYSLPQGAQ